MMGTTSRATAVCMLALLAASDAFIAPSTTSAAAVAARAAVVGSSRGGAAAVLVRQSGGSYAERLRQAREQKAANTAAAPPPPQPAAVQPPAAVARAAPPQQQQQQPASAPSPFTEEMKEQLQTAIDLLSRRLKSGKPLNGEQFERFEAAVTAIMADAAPQVAGVAPPAECPMSEQASTAAAGAAAVHMGVGDAPQEEEDDDDESEGPAWDPSKGYGVPVGTKNSYVIEGMGGMSPEEYQAALREKVISRAQAARKSGKYGNRAANAYLSFLNSNPSYDSVDAVEGSGDEDFSQY